MPLPMPTIEELVPLLQRSRLITVIVEGTTDKEVLRRLESTISPQNVTFVEAGDKLSVLRLYERREELPQGKVAFLVDQDLWVFTGIPTAYSELVTTLGYSLENDLLCDGHSRVEALFTAEETALHNQILNHVKEWFVGAVSENLSGGAASLDCHPRQLLDVSDGEVRRRSSTAWSFSIQNPEVRERIEGEPLLYIRGKTLLACYLEILSASGRPAKYSRAALMEICLSVGHHLHCVQTLLNRIRGVLQLD